MELIWLEDFLELVSARNFSAAAAARHVSQSAFSRRVKSLEAWLGTELIDRSTYPVRLTAAGSLFMPRAQQLLRDMYSAQEDCRNLLGMNDSPIQFSALHTLAIHFFPRWFRSMGPSGRFARASMDAGDFRDCIEQLTLRKCDFALVYDQPDGISVLRKGPFESAQLGTDLMIPVSGCGPDGQPLYDLAFPHNGAAIPYLSYSWNDGYLGKVTEGILARQPTRLPLSSVYESSMADGLRQMALAGAGVAWLPRICVHDDLADGRLRQIGDATMTAEMQIRIFRHTDNQAPLIEAFWKTILHP